jgi:predicted dehydrogenase
LGIVLKYPVGNSGAPLARTVALPRIETSLSAAAPTVGVIGAGNFTGVVLLPHLQRTGARLRTIVSAGGVTGTHFGRKFGFEQSSSDPESVFSDPAINTVLITTRHNSHASFVLKALRAGKHVYVEKPLCLTPTELVQIAEAAAAAPKSILMVGFNRRFAPHIVRMKSLLESVKEPKTLIFTVNAGFIPATHWTQDPAVGGGRIIGEACHYIDLLRFLVGSEIRSIHSTKINPGESGLLAEDKMSITLSFEDGSHGTVHYFANGHKSFPKERLDVFCAGRVLELDNFRKLRGYGWQAFTKMNLWRQDKGHAAEIAAFISAVAQGNPSPIPSDQIFEVTRASFEAAGLKQ